MDSFFACHSAVVVVCYCCFKHYGSGDKSEEKPHRISPKEKAKHKGKWLTWDAVNECRRRAQNLKKSSGEITKELRLLVLELMDEYGVTEIEAINIVNGYNTADYVQKYTLMQKAGFVFISIDL